MKNIPKAYLLNDEEEVDKETKADASDSSSDFLGIEELVRCKIEKDSLANKRKWSANTADKRYKEDVVEAIAILHRYFPTLIISGKVKQNYKKDEDELSGIAGGADFVYRGCFDKDVHRWARSDVKENDTEPILSYEELLGCFYKDAWIEALKTMTDCGEDREVGVAKDLLEILVERMVGIVESGVDLSKKVKEDRDWVTLAITAAMLAFPEIGKKDKKVGELKKIIFGGLFGKD